MKPRDRVLHFAVSGALLGGGAVEAGCRPKHNEEYSNTGPMNPPYDDDLHVNPGPDEDPGAADGAAAEGGAAVEGGAAEGGAAEGGPAVVDVNPGPVEQPDPAPKPPSTVIVNTAPQPTPEVGEPSTNNVRKVEEPARKRKR